MPPPWSESWEHAVVIAVEISHARSAGVDAADIDLVELQLLGKEAHATLPSFRDKARRPHEARTLSQWRVDIASAMLLNQSLAENRMFVPTDLAWTALLAEAVSGAAPGTVELVAPEPVHAPNLSLPS